MTNRAAILGVPAPQGTIITPERIGNVIGEAIPERFSRNTLGTIARNAASSWTQSGHLTGKVRKVRTRAIATPAAAAYAVALGYMDGARGKLLLSTPWSRLPLVRVGMRIATTEEVEPARPENR